MGWDLTALVDPARPEDTGALLVAWAAAFGDGVAEATLRGGAIAGARRAVIRGAAQVQGALAEWAAEHVRDDGALDVELLLDVEGDPDIWPAPVALACGPRHAGPQGTGRRVPLVLGFGDRRAYAEGVRLAGGVTLDETFVRQALEGMCRALRPTTLVLEEEQATGLPLNAHLVYHRDVSGFEQDLRDIAQMTLHGGGGLDGARAHVPKLSEALRTFRIVFAGRVPEHSRELVRLLEAHAAAVMDPAWSLDHGTLERALLESEDLDLFADDGHGVGFAALPFLEEVCEDPYVALLEAAAGGRS
ncbi:MAG: hypothetical protein AMXMBFR64_36180 [Myxococcales bacterium]